MTSWSCRWICLPLPGIACFGVTKPWNCFRKGQICGGQNKCRKRWFPPSFPKAGFPWVSCAVPSHMPGPSPGGCHHQVTCLACSCCLAKRGDSLRVFPCPLCEHGTWEGWAHPALRSFGVTSGTGECWIPRCPLMCPIGSGEWEMAQARSWIPTVWAGKHRWDPEAWLAPYGLQAGWSRVWPQLVVLVAAGGNVCSGSITVLTRGRSCLQTLLWMLGGCCVPRQKLPQRRLFGSALVGRNGICFSVPCATSQWGGRRGVSLPLAIAPVPAVLGMDSEGW